MPVRENGTVAETCDACTHAFELGFQHLNGLLLELFFHFRLAKDLCISLSVGKIEIPSIADAFDTSDMGGS